MFLVVCMSDGFIDNLSIQMTENSCVKFYIWTCYYTQKEVSGYIHYKNKKQTTILRQLPIS